MANFDTKKLSMAGILVSLGIVFGDIGTSPLYVMKTIIKAGGQGNITEAFIEGALSCIFWTLTLQTTVKYVMIALRADNKGEGGILALFSLVKRFKTGWLYLIAIIGAAALVADGVITPSLTVISAIEGLEMIVHEPPIVPITCVILVAVFFIQQFGTNFIGKFFGPVMVIWFGTLAVLGLPYIGMHPEIITKTLNPMSAINLIVNSPSVLVILGAVFLCTTGAEALYSDLGHCGIKNIRISWILVKVCLILNYLGQGAWALDHSADVFTGANPFFKMMPEWFLIPGIILSTAAAIIASQALITGSFTIFSEAMSLNFWPTQSIDYPSGVKGQMYISRVNWGLLLMCLAVVWYFQESSKMEAAYGLSITVTMLMTTVLLGFWLRSKHTNPILLGLFLVTYMGIELGFFGANIVRFFEGGWTTLVLGGIIGVSMYAWFNGRKIKTKFMKFVNLENYTSTIQGMKLDESIPKFATNLAYFSRGKDMEIESKIIYSMIRTQPKRADHYFLLSIINHEDPYTFEYKVRELIPGTIYKVEFILGFKIDRSINDYFLQVLDQLMDEEVIPNRSSHPSLRSKNIPPDLKYVIIDNVYINDSLLTFKEKLTLNLYSFVKKIGSSDFTSFGLSTHNVVVESAPLMYNPVHQNKIKQTDFQKFES